MLLKVFNCGCHSSCICGSLHPPLMPHHSSQGVPGLRPPSGWKCTAAVRTRGDRGTAAGTCTAGVTHLIHHEIVIISVTITHHVMDY